MNFCMGMIAAGANKSRVCLMLYNRTGMITYPVFTRDSGTSVACSNVEDTLSVRETMKRQH